MIFLLSFYTLLNDATYIFNFISQSKILLGVFRTIKIKFRTSGLLVVSRYSKYLNERSRGPTFCGIPLYTTALCSS